MKGRIMSITRRPFHGETDIIPIIDLVSTLPLSARHVIDLPWRLSTPAVYEAGNAVLWEDVEGHAVGFAVWQYYWAVLDFFILPGPHQQEVEADLFSWADGRFRVLDQERGRTLPYWVAFRDDDGGRRRLVHDHGFHFEEHDYYVLLQHRLRDLPRTPVLPDGLTLRSLAGVREAGAYTALHSAAFESSSMTTEWRERTMRLPQYRSELDLVIVAPDATLAGFCVGWFSPEHHVAQIEPLGVHPNFRRLGLSRILLIEILHRFQEHGAISAFVETNIERAPAREAYQSVGFQQVHTIRSIGKWVGEPAW
jgi:mycothiol synthase